MALDHIVSGQYSIYTSTNFAYMAYVQYVYSCMHNHIICRKSGQTAWQLPKNGFSQTPMPHRIQKHCMVKGCNTNQIDPCWALGLIVHSRKTGMNRGSACTVQVLLPRSDTAFSNSKGAASQHSIGRHYFQHTTCSSHCADVNPPRF